MNRSIKRGKKRKHDFRSYPHQKRVKTKKDDSRQITLSLGHKMPDAHINMTCLRGWEIMEEFGRGAAGLVVGTCNPNTIDLDCRYVMKIQFIHPSDTNYEPANEVYKYFRREVEITEKISNMGIGPKLYAAWVCDGVGVMVMEKWDGTLDRGEFPPEPMLLKLIGQINRLHANDIVHADITDRNILVKRDSLNRVIDITLADFGLSDTIDHLKKKADWVSELYDYHNGREKPRGRFYKHFRISLDQVLEDPKLLDKGLVWYWKELILKFRR